MLFGEDFGLPPTKFCIYALVELTSVELQYVALENPAPPAALDPVAIAVLLL